MEDILAIIFLFGGGTLVLLAISPVGKAVADRIRFGKQERLPPPVDEGVYEELDRLRIEMNEVHERLDFTERLLTEARNAAPAEGTVTPERSAHSGGGST